MALIGWLLAYWGLWMVIGSLVMSMRFPDFSEEMAEYRDDPIGEKFVVLWSYLKYLTVWPAKYRLREQAEDDDDDDDDEPSLPQE
jgi:hypothetical protein